MVLHFIGWPKWWLLSEVTKLCFLLCVCRIPPPPPRLCSILVMPPCFYWQLISHSPPFLLIPDWSPPKIPRLPPPFAPKTINNEWFEEQNMCQWYLNPCHMKVVITNCICCRLEYPKCDQTPLIWTAEWEHN